MTGHTTTPRDESARNPNPKDPAVRVFEPVAAMSRVAMSLVVIARHDPEHARTRTDP